jgi:hypothetical protein
METIAGLVLSLILTSILLVILGCVIIHCIFYITEVKTKKYNERLKKEIVNEWKAKLSNPLYMRFYRDRPITPRDLLNLFK